MKYRNPVLASFTQLLLLNPALTLSHWSILRDIILKYYLHNRMLKGTFPMMKLLLRAIGDIVPHLLKKGTRSSQGYPPALPSGLCPSLSLCRGTGSEHLGRGYLSGQSCQSVLYVKAGGSPPGQRASRELHGEADLCPEFVDA